jgi:hypothetical protein
MEGSWWEWEMEGELEEETEEKELRLIEVCLAVRPGAIE